MKSFDWFGLAPYGAGSPPALVLSINLYNAVMTAVSPSLWFFGVLVAVLGVVGMMAVEIGTYKMLARAFANREWGAAFWAFVGACVVTGMIVFSVYSGTDTRALFTSTAVMLVGYLALMVREYMQSVSDLRALAKVAEIEKSDRQNAIITAQNGAKIKALELQLAAKRIDANIANAKVREAKASRGQPAESLPKVSESFAPLDWRSVPAADREKMRTMTVKEIMERYQRSERTSQNWKKNAESEVAK